VVVKEERILGIIHGHSVHETQGEKKQRKKTEKNGKGGGGNRREVELKDMKQNGEVVILISGQKKKRPNVYTPTSQDDGRQKKELRYVIRPAIWSNTETSVCVPGEKDRIQARIASSSQPDPPKQHNTQKKNIRVKFKRRLTIKWEKKKKPRSARCVRAKKPLKCQTPEVKTEGGGKWERTETHEAVTGISVGNSPVVGRRRESLGWKARGIWPV